MAKNRLTSITVAKGDGVRYITFVRRHPDSTGRGGRKFAVSARRLSQITARLNQRADWINGPTHFYERMGHDQMESVFYPVYTDDRFHDAKVIDNPGASNPLGVINTLFEYSRAMCNEGTDTIRDDAALRLIVHQLAHLFHVTPLGYEDYKMMLNVVNTFSK